MRTRFFLVVLLAGSIACASTPTKQRAVAGLNAAHLALSSAQDAERLLCNPTADQSKPIQVCSGSSASSIGLTSEKHRQIAGLFQKAFDSEQKADLALKLWRSGDPAPSTVSDYKTDVTAVLVAVETVVPSSSATVQKIQETLDNIANALLALGVK